MKKYALFIKILLVLLSLFPLIFGCLACFRTGDGSFTVLANVVESCEIVPSFTQSFSDVFVDVFGADPDAPGYQIFCVILSNTVFVYIGFVFVEVMIFIPKMAISLLRMFARKDD